MNTQLASFNKLTPAEVERLSCLAEECGEVVQMVGKILRHGYEDYSPFDESKTSNRHNLEKELGDLRYWMIAMCLVGDVRKDAIHHNADMKALRVVNYLHHQD
jgi:NTP pyrophosphatase (non-canonical NTP hydrolase)